MTTNQKHQARLLLAVAVLLLLATHPAAAQAAGGGSLVTYVRNILNILTGQFGQIVATIGVACAGLAWLGGRMAGGVLIAVLGGVCLIFSAPWIVSQISGGGGGGGGF